MITIGDHLWQSTLVAGGAAALVLLLRNNHAHVRQAIWLTASLKFLIPFAALIAVGRRFGIAPPAAALPDVESPINVVVDTVARPFSMRSLDAPIEAINSQRFDITATTAGNPERRWSVRCGSRCSPNGSIWPCTPNNRDMAIYEMVVARGDRRLGEKLRPAGPDCAPLKMPPGMPPPARTDDRRAL